MTLSIRNARTTDAAALAAIYGPVVEGTAISFELGPPDEAEFSRRVAAVQESYPWLVAETADGVVGYAYATSFRARPAYRWTVETSVYVAQGAQGQGVGRALMVDLLARLRAQGFHMAIAGATLPNEGSARLHEALGFTPVGSFRDVGFKFGRWHAVGFWELELQPLDAVPAEPLPPAEA